ncbi:hypothetical protein P7F88_19345 [Vibrio hannami]|uniref:hypothetical protein n=1 Tax=Vibrio hannami TaxID=2717094 RepID=UPI002410904D|nr:hypothetical protein [Vibrio hannami]MDG3088112.1 hypothetical protein [Vibrio hannami]
MIGAAAGMLGGGLNTGGGAVMPSSSATATNGDFGAAGPNIQGMTINSGTPTEDKAIYGAVIVFIVIAVAMVWKK